MCTKSIQSNRCVYSPQNIYAGQLLHDMCRTTQLANRYKYIQHNKEFPHYYYRFVMARTLPTVTDWLSLIGVEDWGAPGATKAVSFPFCSHLFTPHKFPQRCAIHTLARGKRVPPSAQLQSAIIHFSIPRSNPMELYFAFTADFVTHNALGQGWRAIVSSVVV